MEEDLVKIGNKYYSAEQIIKDILEPRGLKPIEEEQPLEEIEPFVDMEP
jgi:hypothetical protein